jgi:hypothetical protein
MINVKIQSINGIQILIKGKPKRAYPTPPKINNRGII